MRSYRDLRVWEEGHRLTLRVYELTRSFPADERFGLTSQMRRAAAAIPANIVEGSVRTRSEFAYFLRVALGSAAELQYHFILARDLGYLAPEVGEEGERAAGGVQRMLVQFLKYIETDRASRERSTFSEASDGYDAWLEEGPLDEASAALQATEPFTREPRAESREQNPEHTA